MPLGDSSMATEHPTPNRCNEPAWLNEAEREDPEASKSGYCEQYPLQDDGVHTCRMHFGTADRDGLRGAPEGNGNAIIHGAKALPENLYTHLDDDERANIESLAEGYIQFAPFDGSHPLAERVLRYCTMMYQEWKAAGIVETKGPSEYATIGVNKYGEPVRQDKEHHLSRRELSLNTKIRTGLKDLGCLPDSGPSGDSDGETIAQIFKAAVEQASSDTSTDTDTEYVEASKVEQ